MKKFGHFDDINKEYVIENPRTPFLLFQTQQADIVSIKMLVSEE